MKMLIRSLARPFGAMLALSLLAACGGDAGEAPEPAETGAPATTPPPATDAAATPSATGAEPAAGGASTALVEEGRQVFNGAGICMPCHGPTAEGTPLAPDLTDDVWLWIDGNQPLEPQIVQVIREGVP